MGWQGIELDIIAFKNQNDEICWANDIKDPNTLVAFMADPDDTEWDEINFDLENVRESLINSGYDQIFLEFYRQCSSLGNICLEMNNGLSPIDKNGDIDRCQYALSEIKKLTFTLKSRKELYPEYYSDNDSDY